MKMKPSCFLDVLKILVSPAASTEITDATLPKEVKFDVSLSHNIDQARSHFEALDHDLKLEVFDQLQEINQLYDVDCVLDNFINKDENCDRKTACCDIRWEFVKCNLKLLLCLKISIETAVHEHKLEAEKADDGKQKKNEFTAPRLSPDVLSVAQQKWVLTSLQFVACLGLCPCYFPGVGIPVERRSGFGQVLTASASTDLAALERNYRLWFCVRVLLECGKQPSLGSIVLSRYLGDVLASLIQVCYAPIKKKPTDCESGDCIKEKADVKAQDHNDCLGSKEKTHRQNGIAFSGNTSLNSDNCSQSKAESIASSSNEKCLRNKDGLTDQSDKSTESDAHWPSISDAEKTWAEDELQKVAGNVFQPMLVRELLVLQAGAGPMQTDKKTVPSMTRPPAWLRRICGRLLSKCLLRPGGLMNVLRGVLEGQTNVHDWKKMDAAAKIIASCPPCVESKDQYYQLLAPQILALLHIEDKLVGTLYVRIAGRTLSLMLQKEQVLTERYLVQPLMSPLVKCLDYKDLPDVEEPVVFVTEKELSTQISDLHQIMGAEPQSDLLSLLTPVLQPLFKIYCFSKKGVAPLRKPVEDLISSYLKHCGNTTGIHVLDFLLLGSNHEALVLKSMNKRLVLTAGGEGGIAVLLIPSDSPPAMLEGWETTANAMMELLQKTSDENLTAEVFLMCLKYLTNIISEEVATEDLEYSTSQSEHDQHHLEPPPGSAGDTPDKLLTKLMVLTLLANMCDTFGPSCLKRAGQIMEFVKVTLERCIKILDNMDDIAMGTFEGETITMAMGLLISALGGEVEVNDDDREKSKELLPLIQRVIDSHPDILVKQLAVQLQLSIATHGKASTEDFEAELGREFAGMNFPVPDVSPPLQNEKKLLIEEISSEIPKPGIDLEENPLNRESSNDNIPSTDDSASNSLGEALKELEDPMLPVQGHALITLRRLIQNKDPEATRRSDLMLKIFMEKVNHGDSYIYLAAIEGLFALADQDPDNILQVLVNEFTAQEQYTPQSERAKIKGHSVSKSIRSAEIRMKIGEVLVKTTKKLGDMAPKYRDLLLSGFLSAAREEDLHIRASSLSNMGEVCKLLRFSLGKNIYEIVECVTSLIKDSEVEVRRAAAMFITLLIRGLGSDALKILGQALRDLYRTLKQVIASEKDETVQLHAELAMEELDVIMRDLIFPKQTLEKKIHVINPP